ncbi:nucleoside triphosphate hydrolase [Palleronia sp.]|uniref:nucleoside triphosphate hydrolase n=1 Tax=Palleronia sp. TaxID=1940284 RepID=UPI0035C7A770
MTESIEFEALLRRLEGLDADNRRCLVAIAGAPGSGKSTLADRIVARLNTEEPARAAILPMDGFHYDNLYLEPRGLLFRKGAPETFDIAGFQTALSRLADKSRNPVAVPVFDRSIDIARAGARIIGPETRIIIVEGNYLLLDRTGWRELRAYFDSSVFLDVPVEVLQRRLLDRWASTPPELAARQVEGNDLPNARLVISCSAPADFCMSNA